MRYIIKRIGRSVEISEATSSVLVYRIPYQNLYVRQDETFKIQNKFIVYILVGENKNGCDVVYVGKSTNGLRNRPTSHDDKYDNWTYCYILTQFEERTFFNDGTIQYIEDQVNKKINEQKHYKNTTKQTNTGTANKYDEEDCKVYLHKAYEMLDILGLDLITYLDTSSEIMEVGVDENEIQASNVVPDGIYQLTRKLKRWGNRTVKARMQVVSGKYIVLSGSDVCPHEGVGLRDEVRIKRESAEVINDTLKGEYVFKSPSAAASFVIGAAANGWIEWKTSDGESISFYRT